MAVSAAFVKNKKTKFDLQKVWVEIGIPESRRAEAAGTFC